MFSVTFVPPASEMVMLWGLARRGQRKSSNLRQTSERKRSVSPGSAIAVSGPRPSKLVSPGLGRRQERNEPGITRLPQHAPLIEASEEAQGEQLLTYVGQHSGVVPFR